MRKEQQQQGEEVVKADSVQGSLGIRDTSLARYLDGQHWQLKNELRQQTAQSQLFSQHRYDLSLDEMRDLSSERVKFVIKLPTVQQQLEEQIEMKKHCVNKSLAIGEVLSTADLTTGVKMGVVCWLFGGAIINLGSQEHIEKWFKPLKDLKFTGMFAMTERGHGSNVRGIQTRATYDPTTQEFIIHTPCEDAEKMYIGNAMKGNYAAVFAQLVVSGQLLGPHCFIVPVRDDAGNMHPGVTVIDMMHKEGLNGVDNGILVFDNVRIPKENLLNKFGSVSENGVYESPIEDKGARFNVMLAALTPTRIALIFQALGAMKLGLTIAIRYSHSRRQFGPKDKEEVKIIEHQTQYLRLMPHLAASLALTFTSRYAGEILDEDMYRGRNLANNRSLQALVAGLKAYSTWENLACLQDCRECTGGMGYMMENRIPGLKCDSDVFVTFEGDNVVMLQVVVRELLAQYARQYEEKPVIGLLRNWTGATADSFRTSILAFSTETVGSLNFLLKALNYRERVLQRSLAARLYSKVMKKKEEPFSAWNSCLHHITYLAMAHIHRVTLEQFWKAVEQCPATEDQALLKKFCLLHGTNLLYQERAWYLEHKYLTPTTSMQIRNQLTELCSLVKEDSLAVLTAFNIPIATVHAPIAGIPNPRASWAFYPKPDLNCAGAAKATVFARAKL
ncbi:acyl-coenzyme A oxidase-like protein isoform X1 [Scyliorhinus canicula]|uniref:acyl-coenzyme A oxidase-like protein isoform X1 n=2 Tax=Scyliorhinus canicula TaxID=7830 RepID=UPI0018F3CBFC|nr:acyl-coenzyme A oxidase-like protein isoform X1 [Scyliorhinus canicula]